MQELKRLIDGYYDRCDALFRRFLDDKENIGNLNRVVQMLDATRNSGQTIFLIGNGASSAMAEHTAIDMTKNAKLKAISFSGTPMLTTLANDYGYEHVFGKAIEAYAKAGDILIAISSSGSSKNILNGCRAALTKDMTIITLSGFEKTNPLCSTGHINFWLDSRSYGFVEVLHGIILHYIIDSIVGKEIYVIQ